MPTSTIAARVIDHIKAAVGPDGWSDDAARNAPMLQDQRRLYQGATPLVVRPATTAEVAAVVRICAAAKVGIVPQGGNTGLVGGATPSAAGDQILVSLSRMNRIRELDAASGTMTVEAGCVLAHLQEAADRADRLFPLSLGAEGTCQIGGNLAANAGGLQVLHYGTARALTLGIEAVLPDGRVWDGLRALPKDNTGYDLKQLFIGSEGTLGIITAAVLRLFPKPRQSVTAMAAVATPEAALAVQALLRAASGERMTACELISERALGFAVKHVPGVRDPFRTRYPWVLLVEFHGGAGSDLRGAVEAGLAEALSSGAVADAALAETQAQADAFWRLRESIPEAQRREGGSIKHDIAVPPARMGAFLRAADPAVTVALPGVRVCAFGHLGDGNLHYNLSQPEGADSAAFLAEWGRMSRIVHDVAAAHGGSISAEHGIGQLKRAELPRYKAAVEMDLMRAVKRAFDPDGIMNPGKLL